MEKVLKRIGVHEEIAESKMKLTKRILEKQGIFLKGIKGSVWLLALSPESRFIASAGYSNKIFVWNIKKERLKSILKFNNLIVGLSFYSEFELIVVLECGKVYFMNFKLEEKSLIADFLASIELSKISVNYCLGLIITIGKSGDLHLFDIQNQSVSQIAKIYKKPIKALVASQLTRTVYFANDIYIICWDIESKCKTFKFVGHSKTVSLISLSKNEESLISASIDNALKVWNLKSQQIVFQRISESTIQNLVWSNSHKFYVTSEDSIKIWDTKTNFLTNTLDKVAGTAICLALTQDDSVLVAGTLGGSISMWNLVSMSHIGVLKNEANVKKILFFNDFKDFITIGNYGNALVWNVKQKKVVKRLEDRDFIEDALFDKNKVALINKKNQVIIYNAESWERDGQKFSFRIGMKVNCFIGNGFIVSNLKEIYFWKNRNGSYIPKVCNNEFSSLSVSRSRKYIVLNFAGVYCEIWIKVN